MQPNKELLLKMLKRASESSKENTDKSASGTNAKPIVETVSKSLNVSGSEVKKEENQNHLGYAQTKGPHGYFRLDYGHTVSLGDFQYAKVTASISVPVGVTDDVAETIIKDANAKYDICRKFLEARLAEEIVKLNKFALEFQEKSKGGRQVLGEEI
jgi:hypothetical protein